MPSPFPGMNPYLEVPALWAGVHHGLMTELARSLQAQSRPRWWLWKNACMKPWPKRVLFRAKSAKLETTVNGQVSMAAVAITEAVQSLSQVEALFGLQRSPNPDFFTEWQTDLPPLTVGEAAMLDRIKASYLYNSADGALTESTINLLLVSPLLYLAGFCDPPFKLRAEAAVEVAATENATVLRGRIDALVLHNQLWLILVESKQTKFSFSIAIPQALAYMMATPTRDRSMFGLVTNGDGFLFIKLTQQPQPTYALSDDFSLFRQSRNQLYDVLSILKGIGRAIAP
jgi:hypothetical protein